MRLERKDSAKSKVDEEAKKAKDNIDKGATNNDVIELKIAVVTSLKIQPDTTKKTVVKQTLLDRSES